MTTRFLRIALAIGTAAVLPLALPSAASEDPVTDLAGAICAAPDLNAITSALATLAPESAMDTDEVAEAFGVATFLGDLGRCANRQAIADGFAFFKKGKDAARLDAAFAMGRVAAKPGGGSAGAESYQGSFAVLGTAGDPPSGQ
jgi:hypothetical protein